MIIVAQSVIVDGSALPNQQRFELFQLIDHALAWMALDGGPCYGRASFAFVLRDGLTLDDVKQFVPGSCPVRLL